MNFFVDNPWRNNLLFIPLPSRKSVLPYRSKRQIDLKCSAKTIIHKLKYYEKNIIFSLVWRFDYNF